MKTESNRDGFGRRERWVLIAVTVLVLAPVYAFTASWDIVQSNDPRSAALAGWTLAATGSLAFDERWEEEVTSWPVEGRDGRVYSNRFPGVIAVAAAAYVGPVALGLVPRDAVAHPYHVPVWPATLAAILIAALAAALTYRLFRVMEVPARVAIVAGLVVALGSPLWSISADALWTHGATHALLVGALLALLGGKTVLAALLAAAAVTFRPHLALPVMVLALGQRTWRARLIVAVGGAAGLILVAGYSYWIFGQPLPAAGYPADRLLSQPRLLSPERMGTNVVDWLFHRDRSVLIFVPALALALPRLPAAWRAAPRWVRTAALAGVAYAVAQLGLIRASGGWFFFGHRTTIEALVLASPLLLLSIDRLRADGSLARIAIGVVVGYSIALHAFGAWIGIPANVRERLTDFQEETAPGAEVQPIESGDSVSHLARDLQNPIPRPHDSRLSAGEEWTRKSLL